MLEALDAYRLGQHLQKETSMVQTIEDVYSWFAHPKTLEGGYPIFLLNTSRWDHTCTFLEHGRCRIYDARPKVCRLYPFTVDAGERGKDFTCYQCMDQNASHFSGLCGGSVSVGDWFYENFTKEDRAYFRAETKAVRQLGQLMRSMGPKQQKERLFQILYYRYFNFSLGQPFMEQYHENQKILMAELQSCAKG